MICPGCGTENEAGRKFCGECGRPLAAACPRCGTPNPPAAKFCGECGAALVPAGSAAAGGPLPAGAGRPAGAARPPPHPSPSAASSRSSSPTSSASPRSPRGATPRRSASTLVPLLRPRQRGDRPLRRDGREVHRRRGHGGLGRARSPTRTTPSGPSGPASSSSTPSARSARRSQARAGVLTGEAAVTLGATNQGMVAGDLVNTASRLQSVAPPGHRPRRRGDPAGRRPRRSPSRRPASRPSRARPRPSPPGAPSASSPSAAAATGAEALEAPFVGRDDELRLLKDLFHATVRERRPRLVSVTGPGRHRQDPPRLGVPQVRRRARRAMSGGTRAAAPPTARGSPSGRSARWSARRAGLARDRRRGDDPGQDRRDASRRTCPTRTSGAGSSRPSSPCSGSRPSAAGPEQLFGAWRTFFERLAAIGPGGHGLRGPPLRRLGPPRLHRPPARVEPERARSTSSPWPGPELLERRPDWGAGKRNFTSPLPRAAAGGRDARAPRRPRPGPARGGRPARSSTAPTGSRCTRSRRSGCSSPTASSWLERRRLPAGRRPRDARRAGDAHGAHRRPPRRARRRPTGPSCSMPPSSARASRSPALAAVSGIDAAEPSSRACGRSSGASSSPSRRDPRSPERGQYAFVQALDPRGRLQHPRAGATARSATSPPPASSRSLGTDELAGGPRRPLPRRLPERARGPRGRRPRRPGPGRPPGGGGARRRPRLPRPGRRVPRAGPHGDDRPGRGGRAPRAGRRVRLRRRPPRAGRGVPPPRHRAPARARRSGGDRPGDRRPRRRPSWTATGPRPRSRVLEPAAAEFADLVGRSRGRRPPRPARPGVVPARRLSPLDRGRGPGPRGGRARSTSSASSPTRS